MGKAVAVPYIIAILLGVAVIGLVGYWYASTGGKFGSQSAKTLCDNKFLQWCVNNRGVTFATFAPECTGVVSYSDCSGLTGSSGGGGNGGGGNAGLLEDCSTENCDSGLVCCKNDACSNKFGTKINDNKCRYASGQGPCNLDTNCFDGDCSGVAGTC